MTQNDGTYGYGGGGANYSASAKTATCAGPIKATFTWSNGGNARDLPPASVVVRETCTAGFYAPGNVTGTCSDGLDQNAPVWGGQFVTVTGVRYSVVTSPGTSFPLPNPCSPSVTASGAPGAPVGVTVSYSATATPVTINLSGGIGPGSAMRLLIGQELTATLNAGGLFPGKFNWSVNGGNPFWFYSASNAKGTYTPLTNLSGSQLLCYFARPQPKVTVNLTVHLAVPAGTSPAAGLDATVTQTLSVDKPSVLLVPSMGAVADLPTSVNPSAVQLQKTYYSSPNGNACGFAWNAEITTPAAYVTDGGAGVGVWNWTQLITAGRQEKNNGAYWPLAVNTTTPATVINGVSVLDGQYPYGGFWYPADGNSSPNKANGGIGYGNSDSPSQVLDQSSAIRAYDVLDSFQDFLMYGPPGSASLPVPLQETDWFWEFHATKDAADFWNDSGQKAQWSSGASFPAFPQWTFSAPVGSLVYVSP